jgi:RNA polymerase primary sigma factor
MKNLSFVQDEYTPAAYLRALGKCQSLSLEEEGELAKKIRQNDRQALNRLIRANLKFVVSVCRNYLNQGLPLADLINEGNLGLVRAARRFDETRQLKFISYAVWWVRQSILQALAEQSRLVKLPPNRVYVLQKIRKAKAQLEQRLERSPSIEELAEYLQMDPAQVRENASMGLSHLSLDQPAQEEDDPSLLEVLNGDQGPSPEDDLEERDLNQGILDMLHTLDPKEEEVVKLYFGIGVETPFSLEEIGMRYQITRERVRQIKEKALRKLKHASRSKHIMAYHFR